MEEEEEEEGEEVEAAMMLRERGKRCPKRIGAALEQEKSALERVCN